MTRERAGRTRQRGAIDRLPSGALRVRVFAGSDPVTGKRHDLVEIIPPGPKAAAQAEAARTRLLNQVDEKRHPRTNATVNRLLDRHFELATLERSTLATYQGYADKHIRPLIGAVQVGALDGDLFDSFYSELRRCREHCDRRRFVEHRTVNEHDCDDRCRPHVCTPLGASTIRQIHFILSGALKRAVRWRWLATNPIAQAEPPAAPRANPRPPTAAEAAQILAESWADPDWGTLVWLTMVTGVRRGELCGVRWQHLDLDAGILRLERSIGQRSGAMWEKDTKTHQHRRIALDPETVEVLTEHRARCVARAAAVGETLAETAFVFSLVPDGSTHLQPNSVSQRYGRLAKRLGIATSIHKLRHYSATELIAAGVDVRTVAGRLGHGGGGTTTLRTYAAFVSESDQRAASSLFDRMPTRPVASALPQLDTTAADDGAASLARLLRRAELAGHDPRQVLADAVTDRPLTDARSPTHVLYARIVKEHDRRLDPTGDAWTDWVPCTDNPEWAAYLDALAARADARTAELGRQTADELPGWAVEAFGPVPTDPLARASWETRAGTVAAYRELRGHDDPVEALGPAPQPGQPEAYAAYRAAWRSLDRPEIEREELELSDGQLRMRVRAWDREQTWAPRYVANELAGTRQTADRHRELAALRAAEATAHSATDQRDRLHREAAEAGALASVLDARAAELQDVDDARARWLAHTAATRAKAERAKAELALRHADDTAPDDSTTADDWLDVHRDAVSDDERHREVTSDDLAQGRPDAEHDRAPADVAPADIRELAAREPRPAQEDVTRVPSAEETSGSVGNARRAIAEIRSRDVADEQEAAEHRDAELNRWHADDQATERESTADYDDVVLDDV